MIRNLRLPGRGFLARRTVGEPGIETIQKALNVGAKAEETVTQPIPTRSSRLRSSPDPTTNVRRIEPYHRGATAIVLRPRTHSLVYHHQLAKALVIWNVASTSDSSIRLTVGR